MSKILPVLPRLQCSILAGKLKNCRTFLSEAYQCNDVWESRFNNPLLSKINLDEFYHNLDQRFQKTRQISAVDVDIFANSAKDELFVDEMLDLVHKLRLSTETGNMLDSTSHAVIRALHKQEKYEELLNVLDDRLNYGLFLDSYTANLLLDIFWKKKCFAAGCRVASQLMLQEDFNHPLARSLSLIHCYNYLLKPENWPILPPPAEPEDEVKIRVKYLRNPYDDDHFDLREPTKIIGKTLVYITKNNNDSLSRSFSVLGNALYGKTDQAREALELCKKKNVPLFKEVLDLIPEENETKKELSGLKTEPGDVSRLLEEQIQKAVQDCADKDIDYQRLTFQKWEEARLKALDEQKQRLDRMRRLEEIDQLQKDLKDKETKLWFFENEEKIEFGIESKKVFYPKKWFGKKKKPKKIDAGYVPPEVSSKPLSK